MKRVLVGLLLGLILISLFTPLTWGAPGMSGDPTNGTTDEEGLTNSIYPPPPPPLPPPPPPPPQPDPWDLPDEDLAAIMLHEDPPNYPNYQVTGWELFVATKRAFVWAAKQLWNQLR
jgi:hypothetical protein